MDVTTITTIFSVMQQIGAFLIKYGPGLLADAENIWADLKLAYESATSGTPITPEQQTQIDNALDAANTALQNAVDAAAKQDAADAQAQNSAPTE